MATLTDLIPPSLPPPSSLFLLLSFFPPVLPGIKTSIHAPEETHSRGEKKGTRRGKKVGQFEDHRDQAHCLKLCVSVCLFSLSVCCLSQSFTISDLVASVPANASSEKVGWESLEIGLHSKLGQHWTNAAIPQLCVQLKATV